jgi:catechol 2,3-dioxygenase-like lactoylglutathione lyase family enzyme
VTPSLTVAGAVKALEFYSAVFGATERMRFPGPDGDHCKFDIEYRRCYLLPSFRFMLVCPRPMSCPIEGCEDTAL